MGSDDVEMKCFRRMCGMTRMVRWRNEEMRRRACVREIIDIQGDQLKWEPKRN